MSDLVGVPCSVCSERGHHPAKCPELCDPLRPGFSGAGGGGGHGGGDDEDDHLSFFITCTSRRIPSYRYVSKIQISTRSPSSL